MMNMKWEMTSLGRVSRSKSLKYRDENFERERRRRGV
jgi:hypothetical protein